jgi:hypothetical protein
MGKANQPFQPEALTLGVTHPYDERYRCPPCEALHQSNQSIEIKLREAKRRADAMRTEALAFKTKYDELLRQLSVDLKEHELRD